jgi:hypothetical protein
MGKINSCKMRYKGTAWLSGSVILALVAVSVPVHAAGYKQTNLVASTDASGANTVDPTLINAWGIAIRPAGFGGHFWVESNGAGTTNQFIGDVGSTPLFSDDLRLVTVPGPATGQAVPTGTPTGVVFNPGAQFTITQGSLMEPAKFIFVTDTGTISAWTERKNADGSFDRPSFAKLVVDQSSAGARYFGIALGPSNDRIHVANFGANAGIQTFDSKFSEMNTPAAFAAALHGQKLPFLLSLYDLFLLFQRCRVATAEKISIALPPEMVAIVRNAVVTASTPPTVKSSGMRYGTGHTNAPCNSFGRKRCMTRRRELLAMTCSTALNTNIRLSPMTQAWRNNAAGALPLHQRRSGQYC